MIDPGLDMNVDYTQVFWRIRPISYDTERNIFIRSLIRHEPGELLGGGDGYPILG
jgi:hypothetical protein